MSDIKGGYPGGGSMAETLSENCTEGKKSKKKGGKKRKAMKKDVQKLKVKKAQLEEKLKGEKKLRKAEKKYQVERDRLMQLEGKVEAYERIFEKILCLKALPELPESTVEGKCEVYDD